MAVRKQARAKRRHKCELGQREFSAWLPNATTPQRPNLVIIDKRPVTSMRGPKMAVSGPVTPECVGGADDRFMSSAFLRTELADHGRPQSGPRRILQRLRNFRIITIRLPDLATRNTREGRSCLSFAPAPAGGVQLVRDGGFHGGRHAVLVFPSTTNKRLAATLRPSQWKRQLISFAYGAL